tara:strand:+ start:1790 stop:2752 length:963 start_codon:yes stop_codon:yes gene_type:complete
MKNKPIILIAGEPDSIFFEIFFKAMKKKKIKSPLVLICDKKILINQMKFFDFKKKLEILDAKNIFSKKLDNKNLNIININFKNSSSKILRRKLINNYLENSFKLAFKLISDGLTNKLINGPINKAFLNKKYLGITEYISNNFKKKNTGMLIYNKKLSVCPLTTHLPLKHVSKNITKKIVSEKIQLIDNFFKKYIKTKAKIGVTGLNPHCESISSFNEDEKIIKPVIKIKKKQGINVEGPYSADTIFLKANRKNFNVILGMYHDQVLAPIKTLYEYDAINITMGLPILRVTPDHGPNVKMIGKNKSSPLSLIQALNFLDNK